MESQTPVVFVSVMLNNRNLIGVKRLACDGWDRPDCLRHVNLVCCLAVHADCGRSARHSWCSRVLHRKVVLVRLVACACTGCGGKFGWDAHDASLYVVELFLASMQRAPKKQRKINATVHTAHGDQAKIGLRAQKLWSTNDGLPSLRSFTRCCKTRPQQHTMMRREHRNRTDHHNLCMRMQPTA